MLIRRTGRGQEQDVAPRPAARQTAKFWKNFGWALAYALAICGNQRCRTGLGRLGFDHREGRLDGSCLGCLLDKNQSLPRTLATTSGLFSAAFLALGGSSIRLAGAPGPPVLGGFSTSWAAITSLGPSWQEPAFAAFK